jgi:hypothetical protein
MLLSMILIGIYLFTLVAFYLVALLWVLTGELPIRIQGLSLGLGCAAVGGLGGCLYCLRGMYLAISVRKDWSSHWFAWYILRPIASAGCGAVSFIFLRAGLLVLEAGSQPSASDIGYYALAFVAGLNVDKFLNKLEDVAQAVWGIEKSRASTERDRDIK